MTKTTTNLLLMLITIIAGTYFYITYCSACGTLGNSKPEPTPQAAVEAPPKASSFPFALSAGDFSFSTNDNYNFEPSAYAILTPLSSKVLEGAAALKGYFDATPNGRVNITGYYTAEEDNPSAYPNLGLARANAVKNHLISQGISSVQINTNGELRELVPDQGIYLGPVGYSMDMASEGSGEDLDALYQAITQDPLVLYFNTAAASISLDMEQREKVAKISKYLDKVPTATVSITGHTDNTGVAATNMGLGMDRANFAKQYLLQNGILEDRVTVSSKGQEAPISSNATEEGRAQNRRTVVTLNK